MPVATITCEVALGRAPRRRVITALLVGLHRATERLLPPRDGPAVTPPDQLLQLLQSTAAILADVVRAAPLGARGFHGAGMADGTGFLAMGCEEILMHTYDIAAALGVTFEAPEPLAARSGSTGKQP